MADQDLDDVIARVSNWGRWGTDDEIGCLNYVDGDSRRRAALLVESGESFSLSLPFDADGPQPPGDRRLNPHRVMLQTGTDLLAGVQVGAVDGWGYADDMVTMALQCSTHWDALSHAFYAYQMYNGRSCALVDAWGAHASGIQLSSSRLTGRGVLLDIARLREVPWLDPDYRITASDLERAADQQASPVEPGDILMIRTGNLGRARAGGSWTGYTHSDEPGIGIDALPWLWEHRVAAVAADTWAVEALPSGSEIGFPVHAAGIVHMGLPLGENFVLDDLASSCEKDGRFAFLLSACPLPFTGAVGAPVNPIAVK